MSSRRIGVLRFDFTGLGESVHSPGDNVVGIADAADIFQAALHPKSFVSLGTADHLLSEAADSRYVGEVIATWAGRYLEPAEVPARSPAPPEVSDS